MSVRNSYIELPRVCYLTLQNYEFSNKGLNTRKAEVFTNYVFLMLTTDAFNILTYLCFNGAHLV